MHPLGEHSPGAHRGSREKPEKTEEKDEKKKGGKKPILLIAIGVVVLAAAGGGAWFFLGHKGEEKDGKHAAPKVAEVPKPAQYFPMDPAIVVNLADPGDGPQYLAGRSAAGHP